jgi:hypothetical protein
MQIVDQERQSNEEWRPGVVTRIAALEDERRRMIGLYAAEKMAGDDYVSANRALDRDMERLTAEKAALVAALRSPQQEDFVDTGIRQFCASANARLQVCADFDAKREFLVAHIEKVIYNRYKVAVLGSVPIQSETGDTKLQFRIEGRDRHSSRHNREAAKSRKWLQAHFQVRYFRQHTSPPEIVSVGTSFAEIGVRDGTRC